MQLRRFRDGDSLISGHLHILFDYHFAGFFGTSSYPNSGDWFPAAHRAYGDENYLVPPDITDPVIFNDVQKRNRARGSGSNHGEWVVTEASWAAFSWNPRVIYQETTHEHEGQIYPALQRILVPFDKTPKPTWAEILEWEENYLVDWLALPEIDAKISAAVRGSRDALLGEAVEHARHAAGIHTGRGLEHMPALSYLANRGASAGVDHPRAVLRTGTGDELVDLWTEADAHGLIQPLAERTNLLESARNVVSKRLSGYQAVLRDPHGGLAATATAQEVRDAKAAAANALHAESAPAAMDAAMNAEVARLQSGTGLPADLATAKEVLVERIEAAAMARTKFIMKAATQQGVDRGASCVDEERAVKEIARQCVLGVLAVRAAEDDIWKKTAGAWAKVTATADLPDTEEHEGDAAPDATLGSDGEHYRQLTGRPEATSAFNDAKARIEAVTALNSPGFTVDGTAYTPGTPLQVAGRSAVVRAVQPAGFNPTEAEDRRIAFRDTGTAVDDDGNAVRIAVRIRRPSGGEHFREALVTIPSAVTDPVTVTLEAHNLCGASTIQVKFTPPAAP